MNAALSLPEERLLTGEEFALMLEEVGPAELVEGRIQTMSLTNRFHAEVEGQISFWLNLHNRTAKTGRVLAGDVGIYTQRNPDSTRGADVAYMSHERFATVSPNLPFLDVAPELVVEIISLENRWSEVMDKLREYLAIGVRLAWLVDPQTREVFAYRSLTEMEHRSAAEGHALECPDILPGFSLSLRELFAGIPTPERP